MSFLHLIFRDSGRVTKACEWLIGIATSMPTDRAISQSELGCLCEWLECNSDLSLNWPGNMIFEEVRSVIAGGQITAAERDVFIATLQKIREHLDVDDWTTGLG